MKTRIMVDTEAVNKLGEFDFSEGRHALYGRWEQVGHMLEFRITSVPVMSLEDQFTRYSDSAVEES